MNSGEACACDNWICPHNEEKIKHLPGVVKGIAWLKGRVEEMRKYWMESEEKLKVYTSWQPSDPGTKEAMKTCRPQSDEEGEKRMSWVDTAMTLSHALTAAMVRLEEAAESAEASLAELRKRMGEAREAVVGAAEAMDDGLEQSHDAFLNRALHLLAPPSPAPIAGAQPCQHEWDKLKYAGLRCSKCGEFRQTRKP